MNLPASMTAIDLFAGMGGWSAGAKMAGVEVVWAANHWQEAVNWHRIKEQRYGYHRKFA